MKAIILAAGTGSRLGAQSNGQPKALLKVGDQTLIQHQLEALSAEGVGPVVVVVGHAEEQVRDELHQAVEYVTNPRPGETNSLYSLWLAREWLEGDVLLLNSDLLFHPQILRDLLAAPGCALAYDSLATTGAEQTKVGLNRNRVTDLGKDLPATGARGESLGLIKLNADGASALRQRIDAIIAQGDEKGWVIEGVRSILSEIEVRGVNVAGQPWVEIDFPFDLDRARRQVWPQIARTRFASRTRRLGRWSAVAAIPLMLMGAFAWNMSAATQPPEGEEIDPAGMDWESVSPIDGATVRLQKLSGGTQKWWVLKPGETLRFEQIDGAVETRLEARAVLGASQDTTLFVLGVSVGGVPYRYETYRAGADSKLQFDTLAVTQRDREKYTLPPGSHTLDVQFIAGTPETVLIRVRQIE
jgi:L-glutamine-phosphate cytidylyltransferase